MELLIPLNRRDCSSTRFIAARGVATDSGLRSELLRLQAVRSSSRNRRLLPTNGRVSYVLVVRFAAALEKASLIACPALCSEATAIREIKTNRRAYSVKS